MLAPVFGGSRPRQPDVSPTSHLENVPIVTAPTLELLAWLANRTRSYTETMDVWKTSCPRLAVWEDALADHVVCIDRGIVSLTAAGRELLDIRC
jgi:hypothetical protein